MSVAVLKGYPQSVGDRYFSLVDHVGPASYTQISAAAPPTGGDDLAAIECGMKYIDKVDGGLSDNGAYEVQATEMIGVGSELTAVKLIWKTAHTGAEVTGSTTLSGRTVRLAVWGR